MTLESSANNIGSDIEFILRGMLFGRVCVFVYLCMYICVCVYQEIPHILWNLKVHYLFPKSPPPIPIQNKSFHSLTSHANSWRTNLMSSLHLCLGLQSGVFLLGFPTKIPYAPLLTLSVLNASPILSFDHPNNIWWVVHIIKLLVMSSFPLPWYRVPGPNIFLSTLFSNTLSLCSSLNVSDQVSHLYKTTGKVIVLYILFPVFVDSKLEDGIFCTEC